MVTFSAMEYHHSFQMTEAEWHVCEQLAHSGYMTLEWPRVTLTASR